MTRGWWVEMPLDASISQNIYYSMLIPILQGMHYLKFGSLEVGSIVTKNLSGRTTSTDKSHEGLDK
jgi:hypothetical protein